MWHCGADICVSSVHSNKLRKKVHKQVAVPLTVHRNFKRHILKATRLLLYIVCASKAVYSCSHHTALQCVNQQGCLQFLSSYCVTVCVPARLSTVPVNILHYSVCTSKDVYSSCHHTALQCVCVPARLSTVPVTILHYSVCTSNDVYSSCHHTALVCVCVPARLSTVPVTILHYSVCTSKDVYSYCHHTALQCVCVPARLSTVPVTILHYSVCTSKVVYSSSNHTALQCVYQLGRLQFLSPYCIRVCVPARLPTVPLIILHYSVCTSKVAYSSCHHTALQCVYQQGCLQFLSSYCIAVCVPARLSTVPVTILHYRVCTSKAVYSSSHHTAL